MFASLLSESFGTDGVVLLLSIKMRLALLCLIGLIKSGALNETTLVNTDEKENYSQELTSHLTSSYPHQSSLHSQPIKRQTPDLADKTTDLDSTDETLFDSEPTESSEVPTLSSTDFSEEIELTTEPITELKTELTTERTTESTTGLTTEPITKLETKLTTEPVSESTNELTTKLLTELVTESTTKMITKRSINRTTKRTTKRTTYTMIPSISIKRTTRGHRTSTKIPWTSNISNRTEWTTANLTGSITDQPASTNIYLYFIYAFTILFTIGSMVGLYYLKTSSERKLKKGDSFKSWFSAN